MNSYAKVEWRVKLQRLNDFLDKWQRKTETALREWSHMTELGLQEVFYRILYHMIKEIEAAGYKKARLREIIIEHPVDVFSNRKVSEIKLRQNLEDEMANSVKLLRGLEEEITKRRHLEEEVNNLKNELNVERNSPRSSRSVQLQLSPRRSERLNSFRRSLPSSTSSIDKLFDRESNYSFLKSPQFTGIVHVSPRRTEKENRKKLHVSMSPEVKETMFDPNPTTIAKDFRAIFDNEWSRVFADMRKDYSEQYVSDLLLSWLKDCYLTCITITNDQRENLREDAFKCFSRYISDTKSLIMPNSCTNSIKEFQSKIAHEAVPLVQTICVRRLLSGEDNAEYPLQYIKKCARFCWLLSTQVPPMVLNMDVSNGELINRKVFTSLSPRGEVVEHLVWPAVFRYERGHMLQRGVVKTVS